jgi:hypothetical protein
LPFNIFWLKVRTATNPCKVYFTEDDFTNNENYVSVPVPTAECPLTEWEGPVELPANTPPMVWIKGDSGTAAVELVGFQRRG